MMVSPLSSTRDGSVPQPTAGWRLRRWLGLRLASVPLNRVERIAEAGIAFYRKHRYGYAGFLIWVTHTFLRPGFRVLSRRAWLTWEPACYRQFYGREVRVESGGLLLPELPGVPLDHFLKSTPQFGARLEALGAALRALLKLHQRPVRFPDGRQGLFSHGDASVHNVIYDPAAGTAYWFDFETVHPSHRPRAWRHADDVRALMYSAAAFLPTAQFPEAAQLLRRSAVDRAVRRELARLAEQSRRRPDPFHLGQTQLDYAQYERWTSALEQALK